MQKSLIQRTILQLRFYRFSNHGKITNPLHLMPGQELKRSDQVHENKDTTRFYKSYIDSKRTLRPDENEAGNSFTEQEDKSINQSKEFEHKPSFTESRFNKDPLDQARISVRDEMTKRAFETCKEAASQPDRKLFSTQNRNMPQQQQNQTQSQQQQSLDDKQYEEDDERFRYVSYKVDQSLGMQREDWESSQQQEDDYSDQQRKREQEDKTQIQDRISKNDSDYRDTQYQEINQQSDNHEQDYKKPQRLNKSLRSDIYQPTNEEIYEEDKRRKTMLRKAEQFKKIDNNNNRQGDPQNPAKTYRKILSEENELLIHQGMPVDFPRKR